MAITPSQWSHVLTIPESYTPSAPTSGQTLVITESFIAKLSAGDQATFWGAVQNGGGDVRICTNSDGTGQLPVEVVSLDNVAQTCVIWTRKATYDGTGNLYVFIGKSGETQPPVTDPFGRNAVWVDYEAVNHGRDLSDSTGKGTFLNFDGSPANYDLIFGGGFDYTGLNTAIYRTLDTTASSPPFTLQIWFLAEQPNTNDIMYPISIGGQSSGSAGDDYSIRVEQNATPEYAYSAHYPENKRFGILNTSGDVFNEKTYASYVIDGSNNASLFIKNPNFTATDTDIATPTGAYVMDTVASGARIDESETFGSGIASELRLRFDALPQSHIDTEYANQSDPATFYGTPTIASTGGGTVQSITPENIAQDNSITQASLTQHSVIQPDNISHSALLSSPSLSQQSTLAIDGISTTNSIDESQLAQAGSISPEGLSNDHTIEGSVLTQAHVLSPESIAQASELSDSGLTAEGLLSTDGVTQSQSLAIAQLVQRHILVPENLSQSNTLDTASLGQGFVLLVDNFQQPNNIEQPSLTSFSGLIVHDIGQSQTITESGLTQYSVLVTDSITQQQTIGTVVFEKEPRIGRLRARFGKTEINARFALSEIQAKFGVN